jgi:hypothetical protein
MGAGFSVVALPQFFVDGKSRFGHAGYERASSAWDVRQKMATKPNFRNQTVLVCGGSSGIGLEVASTFTSGSFFVNHHNLLRLITLVFGNA